MNPLRRLARFACVLIALGAATVWLTRQGLQPHESPQQRGLRWLKEEHHLDDGTFAQITKLHEAYFASCDRMCRDITQACRPLALRARQGRDSDGRMAALRQEQRLCDQCEAAAKAHLRQVAALMPPDRAQHFLADMLAALESRRHQHDLQVSAPTRR